MVENISILLLLLITHQIHYLCQSPLPLKALAYAFGMVQLQEPTPRRRSGFARTTSSFDAKCRVNRAGRQENQKGSSSSGIVRGSRDSGSQHGSDSSIGDASVESLNLTDMSVLRYGSPAEVEGEIMGLSIVESRSDRIHVLPCASIKVMEEPHDIHVETPPSDSVEMSLSEEPIELIKEQESNHTEQSLNDTSDMDKIPQSQSEETPARNFLPRNKEVVQAEDLDEYVPLNLKIPAHARAKSNRRSLECIEPILDRKAKLPLGPRDAPEKK